MNNTEQENSAFYNDDSSYNKKINSVPTPPKEIGIDTNDTLFSNIIDSGLSSKLDMTEIESFSQMSQTREQVYQLLDSMSEDATISAVLETYAEDSTEYNDDGKIVWVESSNPDIAKFVGFLIDSMNVDKHIYKWAYNLCKYGDLYLRMYRKSEMQDALFDKLNNDVKNLNEQLGNDENKETLDESIKIVAFSDNDHYVNYVEMVPNPAEMFELTKFGKTYGFIKADVTSMSKTDNFNMPRYLYKFKQKDIEIYGSKEFVHACLEDNTSRTPEEVKIFLTDNEEDNDMYTYSVKRGQSLLYSVFKIWRELQLLENSVMLNRITKSSIVRVIGVEVGDMPKPNVENRLRNIKNLIEQKSAFNEGKSMSEYTNPGPIENNIYVPTRGGIGALSTQQIGGDVDVKSLADLDYFKNKFFGAMRIPKQYFGDTDDGAGFNGGTSLSIISSRYAKMVKRVQNTLVQAITDIINLMLLDRDLGNYVNQFTIHMLPPTTQEEMDRRDNMSSRVQLASDIMNMLSDIEDPTARLKILKKLVSTIVTDGEIIQVLQEEIDRMESENSDELESADEEENMDSDFDLGSLDNDEEITEPTSVNNDIDSGNFGETVEESPEESDVNGELPSPNDLGMDMTDNTQF